MGKRLAHRPVDQKKQEAILSSAFHEFCEQGIAGSSIEGIAARAGVSKVTIYNHFGTKENLFAECVSAECQRMRGSLHTVPLCETNLRIKLVAFGCSALEFLTRPEIIRFERRIAAEIEHHPQIGLMFLDSGPRRMQKSLSDVFRQAVDDGQLTQCDPHMAAGHFFGMLKGFIDLEWRFCDAESAAQSWSTEKVEYAVDRFLKAYAA